MQNRHQLPVMVERSASSILAGHIARRVRLMIYLCAHHRRGKFMKLFAALAIFLVLPMAAKAGAIVGPISVTASSTFPDVYFRPPNLINHGGLLTDYFSGISDFDLYMAGDPQHSTIAKFSEWFSEEGQTGAVLTFDMGSVMLLDRLALWNEESLGAGLVSVALSADGTAYTGMGSFSPTDWPSYLPSYGADIFAFAATPAQFIQLTLSGCPRPDAFPGSGRGCGLGEVAFREAVAAVPEPFTMAVFSAGLAGMILIRRRRAKSAVNFD